MTATEQTSPYWQMLHSMLSNLNLAHVFQHCWATCLQSAMVALLPCKRQKDSITECKSRGEATTKWNNDKRTEEKCINASKRRNTISTAAPTDNISTELLEPTPATAPRRSLPPSTGHKEVGLIAETRARCVLCDSEGLSDPREFNIVSIFYDMYQQMVHTWVYSKCNMSTIVGLCVPKRLILLGFPVASTAGSYRGQMRWMRLEENAYFWERLIMLRKWKNHMGNLLNRLP